MASARYKAIKARESPDCQLREYSQILMDSQLFSEMGRYC